MKEYQSFLYGNTAPQLVPDRKRESEKEYLRRSKDLIEKKVEENLHAHQEFSFRQVAIIAICAMMIVAVVSFYLVELSALRSGQSEIASLKYEYEMLTKNNELLEDERNSSIDYSYVYEYATKELGMQTPESHQVITYERGVSEYVAKRADIPNE